MTARTLVRLRTLILTVPVRVADAPPKGVSVVSTDVPRTTLILLRREAALNRGTSRNTVDELYGCP